MRFSNNGGSPRLHEYPGVHVTSRKSRFRRDGTKPRRRSRGCAYFWPYFPVAGRYFALFDYEPGRHYIGKIDTSQSFAGRTRGSHVSVRLHHPSPPSCPYRCVRDRNTARKICTSVARESSDILPDRECPTSVRSSRRLVNSDSRAQYTPFYYTALYTSLFLMTLFIQGHVMFQGGRARDLTG